MTPAIDAAKSASIDFHIREYQHSPNADSYGLEAVQKLGLHPEQVFKTLVVSDNNSLFVGIIPVSNQLNLKLMAQVLGVKKVRMAEKRRVEMELSASRLQRLTDATFALITT